MTADEFAQAAEKSGCSREIVERGLRANRFPFGAAIMNPKSETWAYIINEEALEEWIKYGTRQVLVFNDKGVRLDP